MALPRDASRTADAFDGTVSRGVGALGFFMLAYPAFWLVAGRTCPTPSGALEPCHLQRPLAAAAEFGVVLVGCGVVAAVVAVLVRRADAPLPPRIRRLVRVSGRALAGVAAVTLSWWGYVVVAGAVALPPAVDAVLTPVGVVVLFPVAATWVAVVAVGNLVGEPAFAVQRAVVAAGVALDAVWVWWLVAAVDRTLARRAGRGAAGGDSTEEDAAGGDRHEGGGAGSDRHGG